MPFKLHRELFVREKPISMRFLIVYTLLAICIGVTMAGPVPHKHHGHKVGHGKATSYVVVTKHESNHGDGHHHDSKGYHEENHGKAGHGEANSYTVVTKHESNNGAGHHQDNKGNHEHHVHGNHYEHKVEHHGNNGHDNGKHSHHEETHGHAKYEFGYGVKDTKTGDIKDQWETRDGDKVKGLLYKN